MDINLPDISGIDLCIKVKKEFPAIKVIGISTFSERSYISRMIENGASGYLIKSASVEEIAAAIQTVLEGKLYLSLSMQQMMHPTSTAITKREKEVLKLIADGLTNHQIAERLFISPSTLSFPETRLPTAGPSPLSWPAASSIFSYYLTVETLDRWWCRSVFGLTCRNGSRSSGDPSSVTTTRSSPDIYRPISPPVRPSGIRPDPKCQPGRQVSGPS